MQQKFLGQNYLVLDLWWRQSIVGDYVYLYFKVIWLYCGFICGFENEDLEGDYYS